MVDMNCNREVVPTSRGRHGMCALLSSCFSAASPREKNDGSLSSNAPHHIFSASQRSMVSFSFSSSQCGWPPSSTDPSIIKGVLGNPKNQGFQKKHHHAGYEGLKQNYLSPTIQLAYQLSLSFQSCHNFGQAKVMLCKYPHG